MEKDWQEENAHLQECRQLISGNVKRYEKEFDERHAKTQELFKAMQGGDVELYNQMMTSASLEEHAANQLRKNRAAYDNPYFGRIDYLDVETEKEAKVYIGKNGVFRNRTEVVIADWRAPISSVYYENEIGEGCYHLPDGEELPINLYLKRTYDIDKGVLKGYYDSDVASNDALLVQYLSKNKDAVLGDIIATIQKEQNEIIRESPFKNILVQGVAGSGKTTVAMHRISYILYNYKERFTSNEFCIIGGNDLLLSYITSGLPELDVHDVKQKRMDAMLTHLLKREWTKKNRVTEPIADAAVRSRMNFMLRLELYLLHMREQYMDGKDLKDKELGTILTGTGIERLIVENPEYSIYRLLVTLDERVRTRIKFLSPEGEKEYFLKKCREYKDYYKNRAVGKSIYEVYSDFLSEYEKEFPGSLDLEAHEKRASAGEYDIYDVAALVLIYYRIKQKKEDEEFGQIFIDEAQDFGITTYYALKKVLPACYFTIMGDVSQNINYETGMNDWEDMRKWILTGEKDVFRLLSKSYRNTIEISEYAGKILEKASFGRYRIEPVIRHGIPVQEYEVAGEEAMYKKAQEVIAKAQEKGYASIAVVCRDEMEAAWVEKWLTEVTVLPVRMTKGLEFDVVLLWNPRTLQEIPDQKTAKLMYVAATRALHELHILRM
ncbi:MAG: HelD family protein [Lachnospiraceae bacterium]